MSAFGSGADIIHSTADRVAGDCVRLVCGDLQGAQHGKGANGSAQSAAR